jgi:glutathionylspermidine synthase
MVDSRLKQIRPLPESEIRRLGLAWFLGDEEEDWGYFIDEMIGLSGEEIDHFQDACSTLYTMYEHAAFHVIQNDLWQDIGIPRNAIEAIRYTWNNPHYPHIYGRFDLAGGLDGSPPKLIEFNADTCTVLPETALVQLEQLRYNKMPEEQQFNHLFDDLVEQFRVAIEANPDMEPTLMISTLGFPEDDLNADVIGDAAKEAGFEVVQHLKMDQVIFSPEEGIFIEYDDHSYGRFDFWFKLAPWDFIANEEPGLMDILTSIIKNRQAVVLNPPYAMLFQSKGLMKVLWDLYPDHDLLLPASFSPLKGEIPYVQKPFFGREGENVRLFDQFGHPLEERKGDFGDQPVLYQGLAALSRDSEKHYYQPGVFYAGGPSALSFRRRDGMIVDEDSEFLGHFIY